MPADPTPKAATAENSEVKNSASAVEQADIALGNQLASHRNDPEVRTASKFGKLGDQGPLYAIAAGLIVGGCSLRNCKLSLAGASMLVAVAAADLTKRFCKRCVRRTRPHVLLDEGHYTSEAGGTGEKPEQSFPSGHMAGTVAAARAISRHYPQAGPWTALAAVMIGVSRLIKGAHWPIDVAAGVVIGWGAEAVTSSVLEQLGARQAR